MQPDVSRDLVHVLLILSAQLKLNIILKSRSCDVQQNIVNCFKFYFSSKFPYFSLSSKLYNI